MKLRVRVRVRIRVRVRVRVSIAQFMNYPTPIPPLPLPLFPPRQANYVEKMVVIETHCVQCFRAPSPVHLCYDNKSKQAIKRAVYSTVRNIMISNITVKER